MIRSRKIGLLLAVVYKFYSTSISNCFAIKYSESFGQKEIRKENWIYLSDLSIKFNPLVCTSSTFVHMVIQLSLDG